MYLYILSKEHLELAQAEAEQATGQKGNCTNEFLLLSQLTSGLAFTRSISKVLWHGKTITGAKIPLLHGTFSAKAINFSDDKQLAAIIWQSQAEPKVDLNNPDNEILAVKIADQYYICKVISKQESFSQRKAHLRKHNHPTSLDPKLARVMINLAGPSKTILDPFCGSGGILIEGAITNKEVTGTDIDPMQIKRAEENLAALNLTATLSIQDANNCDQFGTFDAIVTDLPLGKNAKLQEFSSFFSAAKKTAKILVLGTELGQELDISPWRIKQEFTWYIHKSMTKKLLLLQ